MKLDLIDTLRKWIRDGDAYQIIQARISEELVDILWYIAAIASQSDLKMDDIVNKNIKKISRADGRCHLQTNDLYEKCA